MDLVSKNPLRLNNKELAAPLWLFLSYLYCYSIVFLNLIINKDKFECDICLPHFICING